MHKRRQHIFYYKSLIPLLTGQDKTDGGRKEFGKAERGREEQEDRNRTEAKMLSTRRQDLSVENQSLCEN